MIKIEGLAKLYGPVLALDKVTLSFPPGSITTFVGPSGSGKTTLLRLIAGLELPTRGTVSLDGQLASNPGWIRPPHERQVGFVFQTPSLWPHMTVAQNLAFGLPRLPKAERDRRIGEMLNRVGLENLERRYPAQLSGGQARRVALARTLITQPRRLLLDEPLAHLEPELRRELLTLIRDLIARDNTTLLYVTHHVDEIAPLGGRVLRMESGELVGDGEGE